ncbi:DUF3048 domain-containing protein [Streptomyces sp. NA04227]|uniref:DUF3048 domain-containing protein n=1 Tax=Streptomyces sp. NA04227 TaxID=2742136 RepID=UPI0020CA37E8|nr:DUF3048 domain-containing protein [Streptomyces sp. NA04227]
MHGQHDGRGRHDGPGRRGRAKWTALVSAALLAALIPACTPEEETGEERSTGGGGPVLAVKVDNVGPARPQTGVDGADVVYVEQVEAGLSRLMAVYATKLPKTVGPVRSARESDLDLLRQFDDPVLAFSGAQSKLMPLIKSAPLRPETPGSAPAGAFVRSQDRPAPHNLYVHPDKLLKSPAGTEELERAGVTFGPRPPGGTRTEARTVAFPAARFTFSWSAERSRWLVAMDGTRARTSGGGDLTAGTVVVQYVKVSQSRFHDVHGSNSPLTESTGSGRAVVLRDGRAYPAQWERPSASRATEFTDKDGDQLPFARGPVWIVLAKA